MKTLKDYLGRDVRFTEERIAHVNKHSEIRELIDQIDETVSNPELVVRDKDAHLNYRYYYNTKVGNKMALCCGKI